MKKFNVVFQDGGIAKLDVTYWIDKGKICGTAIFSTVHSDKKTVVEIDNGEICIGNDDFPYTLCVPHHAETQCAYLIANRPTIIDMTMARPIEEKKHE